MRLDDKLHAEHLDRRTLDTSPRRPATRSPARRSQAWRFRVSLPAAGRLRAGSGKRVRVPPFDLGLAPPFTKDEPLGDAANNRLTQRVPFDVTGSYAGCPVDGFALVGAAGQLVRLGGPRPVVHRRPAAEDARSAAARRVKQPPWHKLGSFNPPTEPAKPPELRYEQCTADDATPRCEFDRVRATAASPRNGDPGSWTVTITRPGRPEPIVLGGHGGPQAYPCGTVRKGDRVVAKAKPGASVTVGNPGICF